MAKISTSLSCALALCGILSLSSCSDKPKFIGSWTAHAPVSVGSQIPASSVSSVVSLDFSDDQQNTDGVVTLSSVYDVSQSVDGDTLVGTPYEVHFVATASVDGRWAYDVDDDDDLLLSFDYSTIKIDVDKNKLSFAPDVDSTVRQQMVDFYSSAWSKELSRVFRDDLSKYSVLDDIEVSDNGKMMSFEIQSPEVKLRFNRVIP